MMIQGEVFECICTYHAAWPCQLPAPSLAAQRCGRCQLAGRRILGNPALPFAPSCKEHVRIRQRICHLQSRNHACPNWSDDLNMGCYTCVQLAIPLAKRHFTDSPEIGSGMACKQGSAASLGPTQQAESTGTFARAQLPQHPPVHSGSCQCQGTGHLPSSHAGQH